MSDRRTLATAVVAATALALCTIGLATTSAWLLVRASERPSVLALTLPMGAVQLFALGKAVARYGERLSTHEFAFSVLGRVRLAGARDVTARLPAGLGPRARDVLDLVLRDAEVVQEALTSALAPLVVAVVASGATVALALMIDGQDAVVGGVLALCAVAVPSATAVVARRPQGRADVARRELREVLDEIARDPDGVCFGGRAAVVQTRLARADESLRRAESRLAWLRATATAAVTALGGGAVLAIADADHHAQLAHHLPLADVAVVALSLVACLELVLALVPASLDLPRYLTSWRRLRSLSRTPVSVREPLTGADLVGTTPLALSELVIGYGDRVLLDRCSLTLQQGDVVVVQGESGSGKSSLLAVLAKYLDPLAGHVTYAGVDLTTLRGDTLRAMVGHAADQPYVFATTLAHNLRLAREDASDETLRDALTRVGLGDWLEGLPEQLATDLSGLAAPLSGGEQRRLGLARELVANRPVALVDEPTEGLDAATAAVVLNALCDREGVTTVLVSHRADDARRATARWVLRDGRLSPTG